ncbi:hypothetical protein FYJ31_08690 [Bifidobacterium sp. WCA-178-WT-4B]|nr:hypothetical protein [Bifidobacterium sp. WCA-178-WT-4B]
MFFFHGLLTVASITYTSGVPVPSPARPRSGFRGGFSPSRAPRRGTTTTMVRVTRYKEWNFICRRCLEPMVFEDWPIGI